MTGDADARSGQQYFEEEPAVRTEPIEFDVVVPGAGFRLRTDRGVFSHGHLDAGTGLLLRHDHPIPATGDLLDLGAGAGPIALTMAQRSPRARIWAVDVNQRALDLCRQNVRAAGLDNVVVATPDEVPSDVVFRTVWSNPPIRIGKQALHELLLTWLRRLDVDGDALLVVQRHLGADSLGDWLRRQHLHVDRLASKSGFRLLHVTREEAPD